VIYLSKKSNIKIIITFDDKIKYTLKILQMKKFNLFLVLMLLVTNIEAQTYSGGAGTQSDPYKISKKADMVTLATAVNGGSTYYGKYFLLTTNISGINTCIGELTAFEGTFDGGGYEIEVNSSFGVFGVLSNATVKNLGVKGTVSNVLCSSLMCIVGGICSEAYNNSTIINCYNLAAISASRCNTYVGGICGFAFSGNISCCYNLGTISSNSTSYYIPYAGGICGRGGNITNCFSAGIIVAKQDNKDYGDCSGRINGGSTTINNCYALSTMTINGSTINSQNPYDKNGCDASLTSLQSQSWITEKLNWDFSNVWKMSVINSENKGLPVFKTQQSSPTCTITATSGSGGTISPSGSVLITQGGTQRFDFTPNSGYEIDRVTVDGSVNSAAKTNGYYIFSNITINHTIQVFFKSETIYSGGSGTQSDPYLISKKSDMEYLSDVVDGGITYEGKYFRLITNLTGVNQITTSVGDYISNRRFSGIFDGNGHEIEVTNNHGVFGYIYNATVKNLGVKGIVSYSSTKTKTYAGGICGYASGSTIIECYNTGNISISSSYSSYSGGICGYFRNGSISNCYNFGNISSSSSSPYFSGGICGRSENGSILNCYNSGDISLSSSSFPTEPYAGGICGYGGNITNCFSAGSTIIAKREGNDYRDYSGRIIGAMSAVFADEVNIATVLSGDSGEGWTAEEVESSLRFTVTGNVTFTGTNPLAQFFVPKDARATITLKDAVVKNANASPLIVESNGTHGGSLELELIGENELIVAKADLQAAAVTVEYPAEITIQGDGQLKAYGAGINLPEAYGGGAGIGSGPADLELQVESGYEQRVITRWPDAGTINIKGGIIIAQGGFNACGIGGGYGGNNTEINITGGTIFSTNIGCGSHGHAGNINISGDAAIYLNRCLGGSVFNNIDNNHPKYGIDPVFNYGGNATVFIDSEETRSWFQYATVDPNSGFQYYIYDPSDINEKWGAHVVFPSFFNHADNDRDPENTDFDNAMVTLYGGNIDLDVPSGQVHIYGKVFVPEYLIINGWNDITNQSVTIVRMEGGSVIAREGENVRYADGEPVLNGGENTGFVHNVDFGGSVCVLEPMLSSKAGSTVSVNNNYALSTMTINNSTVNSTDAGSKDGADASMSNFQSQSWIQSFLGWDFGTIWKMSEIESVNRGLPIFKLQQQAGMEQLAIPSDITVYPNPAHGSITIKSSGMKAGDRIEFYNTAGTVVRRYQAEPSQTTLDISSLPRGIYIVNVNGKQVKVVKIQN
jgi:hypothetical protein